MFGLSEDEIDGLLQGQFERFSPPDQALLRMADALANTPANVSDGLYAELRAHFTEEELIEFAADAGQENFRARANRLFDVGSDHLYCVVPRR